MAKEKGVFVSDPYLNLDFNSKESKRSAVAEFAFSQSDSSKKTPASPDADTSSPSRFGILSKNDIPEVPDTPNASNSYTPFALEPGSPLNYDKRVAYGKAPVLNTYAENYAEKNPEPAPSSSSPSRTEILSGKHRTSPPDFVNPSRFANTPLPGAELVLYPEDLNPDSLTPPPDYPNEGNPNLGENLPGVPADGSTAKGFVEDFFEKLSTWPGAVPLQAFWVIVITFPRSLPGKIEEFIKGYDANPWTGYNINVYKNLTSELYQSKQNEDFMYGCFFARSINIPGEKIENVGVNFPQQGLLFPNVISHRTPVSEVSIAFAETNDSFMDIVIRPWSILGGYLGSVARPNSIKGTIEAIFYGKTPPGQNLVKRKSFTFNDVIPIDVNTQEYTQAGDGFITRSAKFLYSNYTVKNESLRVSQQLQSQGVFEQPQPSQSSQLPLQPFPANASKQWQEWFNSQSQQPDWKAISGDKSNIA